MISCSLQIGKVSAIFSNGRECKQQNLHMDFQLGSGVCGILIAMQDGVKWVSDGKIISLKEKEGIIFDSNHMHAGAGYPQSTKKNTIEKIRLHAYVVRADEPSDDAMYYETLHFKDICCPDTHACQCSLIN